MKNTQTENEDEDNLKKQNIESIDSDDELMNFIKTINNKIEEYKPDEYNPDEYEPEGYS